MDAEAGDDDWEGCNFEAAFDYPFAQNQLVLSNALVASDRVDFVIEHIENDGKVLCALRPAFRLPALQESIAAATTYDKKSGEQHAAAIAQVILALGITALSYMWMGFCTPVVVVRAAVFDSLGVAGLTQAQIEFWRDLFLKGLREHLFTNGIRSFDGKGCLDDFCFVCERVVSGEIIGIDKASSFSDSIPSRPIRVLVPMGAGKDSVVAWELLGRVGADTCERHWFFCEGEEREFSKCWRYQALAEASHSEVTVGEFVADLANFHRNRNGSLTLVGHPWACLICFASALVALVHCFDYVAVGNERSAGLGNGIEWEGVEVNHQWDKSFQFERAVHSYLESCCFGLVRYFSVLTPLWDVQVGLLFGHLCPRYLPLILSCNQPEGTNASRWCAKCAKCAFVAAVLGAFFPVVDMRAVFGDDLFECADINGHMDHVAGLAKDVAVEDKDGCAAVLPPTLPPLARAHCRILGASWKPFECVGGAEETRLALRLVEKRYCMERRGTPRYFTAARRENLGLCSGEKIDLTLLEDWSDEHLLPPWFENTVKTALQDAFSSIRLWTEQSDRAEKNA